MKQVIFFIAFILSVMSAYAQTDKTSVGVPVQGYRGFVDLNGEARFKKKYSNDRDIVYSISGFTTTHGYQFNEHFFVGGGIGVNFLTYNYEGASFGIAWPVYVAGRLDWKVGKVPLFADLKVGTFTKSTNGDNTDKLFITPSVGYHCSCGRKVSLNIGVGLSMHWLDRYDDSGLKMMPSVKIGIEFK